MALRAPTDDEIVQAAAAVFRFRTLAEHHEGQRGPTRWELTATVIRNRPAAEQLDLQAARRLVLLLDNARAT